MGQRNIVLFFFAFLFSFSPLTASASNTIWICDKPYEVSSANGPLLLTAKTPEKTSDLSVDFLKALSPEFRFDPEETFFPLGYDQYIETAQLCWLKKRLSYCLNAGAVTPTQLRSGVCVQSEGTSLPKFLTGGSKENAGKKSVYCSDQAAFPNGDYVNQGTLHGTQSTAPLDEGFFLRPSEKTKAGMSLEYGMPITTTVEASAENQKVFSVEYKLFYGYNLYPLATPAADGSTVFAPVAFHEWDNESMKLTFEIRSDSELILKKIRPSQHYLRDATTIESPGFCSKEVAEFVDSTHVRSNIGLGDHANYLKPGIFPYTSNSKDLEVPPGVVVDKARGTGKVFRPWVAAQTRFVDTTETYFGITFGSPRTDKLFDLIKRPEELRPIFH